MSDSGLSKLALYAAKAWAKIPLLVKFIGALVVLAFLLSLTPPGQDLKEDLNTEIVVDETEVVEGETVVSSVSYGIDVEVELAGPASEFGIVSLYLYENGERIGKAKLGPMEASVSFDRVPSEGVSSWTLVAVDGSNRVVSKTKIHFKRVRTDR